MAFRRPRDRDDHPEPRHSAQKHRPRPGRRRRRMGVELSGGQGRRRPRRRGRLPRHQIRDRGRRACDRAGAAAPARHARRDRPRRGARRHPERSVAPRNLRDHHDVRLQRGVDHLADHRHDPAVGAVGARHQPSVGVLRRDGRRRMRRRAAHAERRPRRATRWRSVDSVGRRRPSRPRHGHRAPDGALHARTRQGSRSFN